MYNIVFTKQAAKSLRSIPRDTADLIREKLAHLAQDPFTSHTNASELQGRPGYRLRVGNWRIIYEIQKDEMLIIVLKIALRRDVHR